MKSLILQRLVLCVPVILGVISLVFFIIHLIPGDPVDIMLGEQASVMDKLKLRTELGLNKPITIQFIDFLSGVIRGDLGRSIHTKKPVAKTILDRLPATIELSIASVSIAIIIALPLGIISAVKQYSFIDNISMAGALLGISIPNFWLGPMLIILFSINLGWLPVSGRGSLLHLILPALTLGSSLSGILARLVRSSLLEVIHEDFITTARAKGLPGYIVIIKHGLINSIIPLTTVIGLQLGAVLSGSIITETIFSWPGIGRLTITAITKRDYPLVSGCVLTIAVIYVLVNLLIDLIYIIADPRIRYR